MRNNDPQTKVLSVRIPMEKYLEILQETVKLKISVSDYLLMLIYNFETKSENKISEQDKKKVEENLKALGGLLKTEKRNVVFGDEFGNKFETEIDVTE